MCSVIASYSSCCGGKDETSKITNIPLGLWFSLCTLTSVGYGDLLPYTWLGRIFAALCAIIGVVMTSLTIPIISTNFALLYTHVMSRNLASVRIRRKSVLQSVAPGDVPLTYLESLAVAAGVRVETMNDATMQ